MGQIFAYFCTTRATVSTWLIFATHVHILSTLRQLLIAATNFSDLVAYHIWRVQILSILGHGYAHMDTYHPSNLPSLAHWAWFSRIPTGSHALTLELTNLTHNNLPV